MSETRIATVCLGCGAEGSAVCLTDVCHQQDVVFNADYDAGKDDADDAWHFVDDTDDIVAIHGGRVRFECAECGASSPTLADGFEARAVEQA